jgi:hypothetical protein
MQQLIFVAREKSNMRNVLVLLMAIWLAPGLLAQAPSAPVQSITTTLSSAQLQHLKANPVPLVAAPGAGKLLNLVSLIAQYKSGGSVYKVTDGGQFNLALGGSLIHITLTATGFIDQTSNQVQMNSGSHGGAQNSMENQPLTVSNDGPTEWTDGDGSVIVTVYYTVVDLQ